jgi:hypothetical protein
MTQRNAHDSRGNEFFQAALPLVVLIFIACFFWPEYLWPEYLSECWNVITEDFAYSVESSTHWFTEHTPK